MWVWVNSRSWWWTGRPGVLRFMGLQRVGHNWVNWTELNWIIFPLFSYSFFFFSISVNIFLPEYWDCVSRSQPHSVIYFTSLVHSFNQYSSSPHHVPVTAPGAVDLCQTEKRRALLSQSSLLDVRDRINRQTKASTWYYHIVTGAIRNLQIHLNDD